MVDGIIKYLVDKYVSENLPINIIKIINLELKKNNLSVDIILSGLEDRPINIKCDGFNVTEDGTSIVLGSFSSDMEFINNSLNVLSGKVFHISDDSIVKLALKAAKNIFIE